jgi:murein DD-endopeptidase MepM/ murein hydrolase activator NlpD
MNPESLSHDVPDPNPQPESSAALREAEAIVQSGTPPADPAAILSSTLPLNPVGRWVVREIQPGDSLSRVFDDLGLSPALLHRIVHSGEPARQLPHIKPGQTLRIHLDADARVTELVYELDPATHVKVTQDKEGLSAQLLERDAEVRHQEISAVIESSLFESASEAGLPETLIMELADIFRWDIDFALEIRTGDRFSVVYEEEWVDGAKLRDGPVLAAEFVNQGKIYRAVRFEHNPEQGDYYTPEGKSMRKAFVRTPVDFRRISSRFRQERWHPVLGKKRPHRGVDYAAAVGTPVKAAGDGKVVFRGRKGGYGNTVILQHGRKYTTLYAHLSRFSPSAKSGERVSQGQVIGYVGATGLATGPHLHYEFRINGVHRNPLTVQLPRADPLAGNYLRRFRQQVKPMLERLDDMNRTMVADAQ